MLMKVISGGQTGADIGGLIAARDFGLRTGGWAPKGWITTVGPAPELADFGLVEHSGGYSPRTHANAEDSDGTVRLAFNFRSHGELCTLKGIKKHQRPYCDIDLNLLANKSVCDPAYSAASAKLAAWIWKYNIGTLNVAGNAERKSYPESVEDITRRLLKLVFERLDEAGYIYKKR